MNRQLLSGSRSSAWNRVKIISLTLGILSLTACQSVPTSEKLPRTLTVSGKGDVTIPTTMTQVRLGVEVQRKTSLDVQQQVQERSLLVVELLKARRVEKLETTGINLNPIYSYKDGKQSISGYSGSNMVSFRINTEKAGSLLDEAVKAGATRIDGVSFVATESAIADAQQQAIKEATQNANKQADAALNALHLSQREVIAIQINGANPPIPRPFRAEVASLQSANKIASNTPVVGREQKIESSVTLQIRY